jgi:ribonuclease VapC
VVVDTSAVLHIAFAEPGWEDSVAFLLAQESRVIAAPSLVEVQAVLAGRSSADPKELLDSLVADLALEIAPFSAGQARFARDAYLAYGKGQGHPAQLNFGNVLSYALARDRAERLAFTGDEFEHTDLDSVRLPL